MKKLSEFGIQIHSESRLITLDKSIGKLTKMTLNLLRSAFYFSRCNILAFPSTEFKPLDLLGVIYSKMYMRDILVISSPKKIKCHINRLDSIFLNSEKVQQHLIPFTKSYNRQNFFEIIDENEIIEFDSVASPNSRKILFSKDLIDIDKDNLRKKKYVNKKDTDLNSINLNIGLIIIEDVESFLFSESYFKSLVDIARNSRVKFLFIFSNPYSKYISKITHDLEALTLFFDENFLVRNSKFLIDQSILKIATEANHNIDNKNNYEIEYKVISNINPANIDTYYKDFLRQKSKYENILSEYVDLVKIIDTRFFELYNCFTHPGEYACQFYIKGSFHFYSSIDDFIDIVRASLSNASIEIKDIFDFMLSNLMAFYLELRESKRFFDKKSYKLNGKNFSLLTFLKSNDKEINIHSKYLILVNNVYEKRQLFDDITNLKLKHIWLENINIKNYSEIHTADNQTILLVPGPLRYVSQMPNVLNYFKSIIFFTFEGMNNQSLTSQMKFYKYKVISNKSSEYFHKLITALKIDYNTLPKFLRNMMSLSEIPEEILSDIEYKKVPTSPILKPSITIKFLELKSRKIKQKSYNKTQRVLTYNFDTGYEFKKVKLLKVENLVLDIEGKKNILDLMSEIYDLKKSVDIDAINEYYSLLIDYYDNTGISLEEFYQRYKKYANKPKSIYEFRVWLNQGVIGPESAQDIESLAQAMGNDILLQNAKYVFDQIKKIWSNHVQMGRKLKRIIEKIAENKHFKPDSFEERVVYDNLLFYKVKEVKFKKQ